MNSLRCPSRLRRGALGALMLGATVVPLSGILPVDGVGSEAHAAGCSATPSGGNVKIRQSKNVTSAQVGTLVAGTSIASDCGASGGGAYDGCNQYPGSGHNWFRVYGSTFTGYVASLCVNVS